MRYTPGVLAPDVSPGQGRPRPSVRLPALGVPARLGPVAACGHGAPAPLAAPVCEQPAAALARAGGDERRRGTRSAGPPQRPRRRRARRSAGPCAGAPARPAGSSPSPGTSRARLRAPGRPPPRRAPSRRARRGAARRRRGPRGGPGRGRARDVQMLAAARLAAARPPVPAAPEPVGAARRGRDRPFSAPTGQAPWADQVLLGPRVAPARAGVAEVERGVAADGVGERDALDESPRHPQRLLPPWGAPVSGSESGIVHLSNHSLLLYRLDESGLRRARRQADQGAEEVCPWAFSPPARGPRAARRAPPARRRRGARPRHRARRRLGSGHRGDGREHAHHSRRRSAAGGAKRRRQLLRPADRPSASRARRARHLTAAPARVRPGAPPARVPRDRRHPRQRRGRRRHRRPDGAVRLVSGRLPASCTPTRCEIVLCCPTVGPGGRDPATTSPRPGPRPRRRRNRAARRPAAALGDLHPAPRAPLLLGNGVRQVGASAALHLVRADRRLGRAARPRPRQGRRRRRPGRRHRHAIADEFARARPDELSLTAPTDLLRHSRSGPSPAPSGSGCSARRARCSCWRRRGRRVRRCAATTRPSPGRCAAAARHRDCCAAPRG